MYELLVDDYKLNQEDHEEMVPLYTEAGAGNDLKAIASNYTNADLFNRATRLHFNDQV